jgi:hypothetical protein
MNGIEVGTGDAALYLELMTDGGVDYISLSDVTDEGEEPTEIFIEIDQVDELVQALRTLQALAKK